MSSRSKSRSGVKTDEADMVLRYRETGTNKPRYLGAVREDGDVKIPSSEIKVTGSVFGFLYLKRVTTPNGQTKIVNDPDQTRIIDAANFVQVTNRIRQLLRKRQERQEKKQSKIDVGALFNRSKLALLSKYGIEVVNLSALENEKDSTLMKRLIKKSLEAQNRAVTSVDQNGIDFTEVMFLVGATHLFKGKRSAENLAKYAQESYAKMDNSTELLGIWLKVCIDGMRGNATVAQMQELIEKGKADEFISHRIGHLLTPFAMSGIDVSELYKGWVNNETLFINDIFQNRLLDASRNPCLKAPQGDESSKLLSMVVGMTDLLAGLDSDYMKYYQFTVRSVILFNMMEIIAGTLNAK